MSRMGRPRKPTTTVIGARLREARDQLGWTQYQLSYAAKVPQTRITEYETGARIPAFATAVRLADALGITLDYLAGRTN